MNTYEFDIEAPTYLELIRLARQGAAEFFGHDQVDYEFCAIKAPNLNLYQAKVRAWEVE